MLNLPRRHFLPWDRPLLPQAVAFLAGDWTGPAPLDLSGTLIVVPTRQSGRRLREALAEHAAQRQAAVFPPRVATPELLVAAATPAGQPTRIDRLAAWIELFRTVDLSEYRDVFPVDPPARAFSWALRLAEQFVRLQAALHENGLRIRDVATRAGADSPEAARWEQLARLEQRWGETVQQAGGAVELAVASTAWLAGIKRVVLLATADPIPAALTLLANAGAAMAIDVVVYAPPDEADRFDAWGRPVAEAWTNRTLALPDFERRVHLCADPADQAARVAALAQAYRRRASGEREPVDGMLALGVADPEIMPLVESELSRAGFEPFNPEGRPRRTTALYQLLSALGAVVAAPTFEAVEALARCPDFLDFLAARGGPEFSAARFLAELDELRRKHLPADLEMAKAHARGQLRAALDAIAEQEQALAHGPFPAAIAGVLGQVFAGRRIDPSDPADDQLQDAASAWTEVARECALSAARFPGWTANEWWELAVRLFGDSRRTADKPSGAIELQGWLELLYEDAAHVTVAGLNDGLVPEAVAEDMFLPESLRARLGLKTNAARFARDAYLLQAMVAGRAKIGRVDVLLGKTSAIGDPLRPSRLLLRCPDEELPGRVAYLFRTPDPVGSHLPWTRAWRLHPRRTAAPAQVAVTSLRRWLLCPFRFHLKYNLRMEAVDAAKSEMDAFDFGTLCHAALEAMGREPALRDCTDPSVLREFLVTELNRASAARFGAAVALPLLIQLESARQRLAKLAEVQAAERAAGWIIQEVERPFAVTVAGLVVKGKIDRIDRHAETGVTRVVDYKTSDTGITPRAAHLRPIRHDEAPPEWATIVVDGKPRVWTDLQLPLYLHALAPECGDRVTAGYINLPKAVGQTALALWEDYTPELQASAMHCAAGVCQAIRAGEFWPPNEAIRPDDDEFATLFHHGVAESVAWEAQS